MKMFTTFILISLKINLDWIEFKNQTYPVEAFAKEIATEAETPQVKACTPEATCISRAVRSG